MAAALAQALATAVLILCGITILVAAPLVTSPWLTRKRAPPSSGRWTTKASLLMGGAALFLFASSLALEKAIVLMRTA